MKKSVKLKQDRAVLLRAQQAIVNKAKTENREFTAEEQAELEAKDGEVEDLEKQIATAETDEARELRIASLTETSVGTGFHGGGEGSAEEREVKNLKERFSFSKAVRSAASGEKQTGVEAEMNQEAIREAESLNLKFDVTDRAFSIPAKMVRATAQTVTEDNGDFGAAFVGTEIRPVEGFIPRLVLEDAGATFLSGLRGNVSLPKFSDYEYKWLNEREAIVLEAAEADGPELKPKRAGAGVAISLQLLAQESVGIEAMIYNKLRFAAKLALEKAAINGDGVKAPLGLLNTPGIKLAAAVAGATATWNDIVELWALLEAENVNSANASYVLNAKLAGSLRKIAKDAGSGRFLMENMTIDGAKTIISNIIPSLAGNETLIYGDFAEMYIGQWGGVNFTADPYTGAGSGEIKIFSNLYADVAIANPEAFAVNKFLK